MKGVQALHTPWCLLTTPPLNHCYKTPHQSLPGWDTPILRGMSLLCPPLPGKAVKLFFSTSPKTLFPRFDSAPVHRGRDFGISNMGFFFFRFSQDPTFTGRIAVGAIGHGWNTWLQISSDGGCIVSTFFRGKGSQVTYQEALQLMNCLRILIILTGRENLGGYLQITPTCQPQFLVRKDWQLKLTFILVEQYKSTTGSIIQLYLNGVIYQVYINSMI